MFASFLLGLAFLILMGAVCQFLAPQLTERLRAAADREPGASVLAGFAGLATLFGVLPVAAITIVGLPLIPIAVLLILALWALGYVLGAYVIAFRALRAMRPAETGRLARLGALAGTLAAFATLNFIPILGWILNVGPLLLGTGALIRPAFHRLGAPLAPLHEG